MNIDKILKIEQAVSGPGVKIPIDIKDFLKEYYYSNVSEKYTKFGDLDIIHFIRIAKQLIERDAIRAIKTM
jgi:hypothetical protein